MKTKLLFIFLIFNMVTVAQKNKQTSIKDVLAHYSGDNVNYTSFEVTKEMFKMMSEINGIEPELKAYYEKLTGLQLIKTIRTNDHSPNLFEETINTGCLSGYTKLIYSRQPNKDLAFYKKETKDGRNEFIMLDNHSIIYITGSIQMKSLGEFDQILKIAGSAYDM